MHKEVKGTTRCNGRAKRAKIILELNIVAPLSRLFLIRKVFGWGLTLLEFKAVFLFLRKTNASRLAHAQGGQRHHSLQRQSIHPTVVVKTRAA